MSASEFDYRPVIGVCAAWDRAAWSFWDQDAALVAGSYLEAVRRGGGLPVVLVPEPLAEFDVAAILGRIDGLLLIGGADLNPASYGQAATARTEATSPLRDEFELTLVQAAFELDLPVLGICRGLQILNVAAGGDLHHHLADAGYAEHRPMPGSLDERTLHEVELQPASLLARAGRGTMTVNSHHHQGVAEVGSGGWVVARSVPDGAIEAIEWPHLRYALGVQWHPEALELDATVTDLVIAARAATPNPLEAAR